MIQTSYFASKAPAERKVCISLKRPRFFRKGGLWVVELAPSNPWAEDWQEQYRRDLRNRFPTPDRLAEVLAWIEGKVPNAILCCYEKNPEDCHRRVLAAHAREVLGIELPEWEPGR